MLQVDVEYKDGSAFLSFEQKKFNMLQSDEQELWSVPITIAILNPKGSAGDQPIVVKYMLDKSNDVFVVKGVQPDQPVLVRVRCVSSFNAGPLCTKDVCDRF